jgi:hypothetical protein
MLWQAILPSSEIWLKYFHINSDKAKNNEIFLSWVGLSGFQVSWTPLYTIELSILPNEVTGIENESCPNL